jgi:hypothetical protein
MVLLPEGLPMVVTFALLKCISAMVRTKRNVILCIVNERPVNLDVLTVRGPDTNKQ